MIATHDEGDEVITDRLNHGEIELTSNYTRRNKSKMSYHGNKPSSSSSNDKIAMVNDETPDSLSLDDYGIEENLLQDCLKLVACCCCYTFIEYTLSFLIIPFILMDNLLCVIPFKAILEDSSTG